MFQEDKIIISKGLSLRSWSIYSFIFSCYISFYIIHIHVIYHLVFLKLLNFSWNSTFRNNFRILNVVFSFSIVNHNIKSVTMCFCYYLTFPTFTQTHIKRTSSIMPDLWQLTVSGSKELSWNVKNVYHILGQAGGIINYKVEKVIVLYVGFKEIILDCVQ